MAEPSPHRWPYQSEGEGPRHGPWGSRLHIKGPVTTRSSRSPQFRLEHLGLGTFMQDGCKMGVFRFFAFSLKYKNTLDFSRVFAGSPKGNRTPVPAVRGRCTDRYTMGPSTKL